jgi:hypothetical protein
MSRLVIPVAMRGNGLTCLRQVIRDPRKHSLHPEEIYSRVHGCVHPSTDPHRQVGTGLVQRRRRAAGSPATPVCQRQPRWLISRRLGSGQRIAVRIRAGLAFPGGCAMFPVPRATRFPRAGLAFALGSPHSGSRGPAEGIRTATGAATLRSPWPVTYGQPRSAADIWQAVRKEATPCRTSKEGECGRTG